MFALKLKAITGFFVFFIFGLVSIYFSTQDLIGYFDYPRVIVYSWMDCFVFLFSFVMFLFSLYPGHVAFSGVPMPENKSKGVYKVAMVIFIMSLITPVAFSLIYISGIESKGYIKCQSIPSGWMPGMATKYVTEEALCSKKEH